MFELIKNRIARVFNYKGFYTLIVINEVSNNELSTLSTISINDRLLGFVVEDAYREHKIYGETRIRGGLYECVQNTTFGRALKHKKKYGYDFIVHIKDVPNFKYILFHIGNTPKDTKGCLLLNKGVRLTSKGFVGVQSKVAYKEFYLEMVKAFKKGKVFVKINRGIDREIIF